MEKITDNLKAKYKDNIKGKVYLFIISANNLCISNSYKGFSIDTGVRDIQDFVNTKLYSIYSGKESGYWSEDFKGFEEILEKAKLAQVDINAGFYSEEVIGLIEASIKSYLPKGKPAEKEAPIPAFNEDNEQVILPEKMTGTQYAKSIEAIEEEVIDEDLGLLDSEEEDEQTDNNFDLLEDDGMSEL